MPAIPAFPLSVCFRPLRDQPEECNRRAELYSGFFLGTRHTQASFFCQSPVGFAIKAAPMHESAHKVLEIPLDRTGAHGRYKQSARPQPRRNVLQKLGLFLPRDVDESVERCHRIKAGRWKIELCDVGLDEPGLWDIPPCEFYLTFRDIHVVTLNCRASSRVVGTPAPQPRSSTSAPGDSLLSNTDV